MGDRTDEAYPGRSRAEQLPSDFNPKFSSRYSVFFNMTYINAFSRCRKSMWAAACFHGLAGTEADQRFYRQRLAEPLPA